ncbi:hypothetical protein M5K25_000899 [Dendrobium thyrsiflorum]|uniref:Uncharacterized protein n=1 Tax=Dendrobium thyrsiflorum TaxID=117978 RepID=A0ABD0VVF8_DENTH
MAGRKVEVLESELGQLKSDFEEKIFYFQNQIASVNERMEGKFAVVEDMMKKLLETKPNPATSEANETTGGHGRGGNPNMLRGRENPKVKILEGEDGIPHIEPLSREEMSMGYGRKGADFVRRGDDVDRRGADFMRRGDDLDRRGLGVFLCMAFL